MNTTFQIEHLSFTTATVPASEYIKLVLTNSPNGTSYLLTFVPSLALWFTPQDFHNPASDKAVDSQLLRLGTYLQELGIQNTWQALQDIQQHLLVQAKQRLTEFKRRHIQFEPQSW